MPEPKYTPMTPDQRDRALYDSREKPYHDEFKDIVLYAESLATMVRCGEHSKEELEDAANDVFESIQNCLPAMAISILDLDDCMTSPEHLENEFGGKIQ